MRLGAILMPVALSACGAEQDRAAAGPQETRQAEVAYRGGTVMPFDLDRTTHRFTPNATGGVQQVVSKDGDPAQVALIRSHLQEEAARFRRGDFSSPVQIHGAEMPGLETLATGAGKVRIDYSELPAGAQLVYAAQDPQLVRALHAWFEAQLSDHGRHAARH